jgi:hypothetical protein
MKAMKSWVLAAGVLLGAAGAMAQQGAGTRPGPIVPPGSGMGGGMGAGAGPGMGPGMGATAPAAAGGARWGADDTPGWSLMSEPERNAHQDRMRAMKTYEECKAYADQHHEQMSARAKERGGQALAQAARDPCGRLKR